MKKILLILPALIIVCIFSCTHKNGIVPTSVTPPPDTSGNGNHGTTDTTATIDTSVCFQRDILPIFQSSCAISGCHDAASNQKGYTLTSYATIMSKGVLAGYSGLSAVYTDCANGKMPKSPIPKLDSAQLSMMKRWIDQGAHDDTDCAVICDTTKYTYSKAIAPILKTYCYSCHATASAASSGGGIILDNYNGVLTQAQNGRLLGDIQHATGHNYMPLGGNKLQDCQITQVSKWISAGAQNN